MGNKNSITCAPPEILNNLKCVNCSELLTCPPVHLYPGQGNVCGRCPSRLYGPSERNTPFEALLSLQMLPCRYVKAGCTEELKSSNVIIHEEDCYYREFACPAMPLGSCGWKGLKTYSILKDHFTEKHPSLLYGNETTSLQLKSNSLTNILVLSDCKPFLLQLNYHLQSQTLWSALLYYNKPAENHSYSYVLELISSTGKKFIFPSSHCYSAGDTLHVNKSKMCETPLTQIRNILDNTKELKYNVAISMKLN